MAEVQAAAGAALLLAAGLLAERAGVARAGEVGAVVALAAGGSTFVPGALRNLRHGRIGVATLMTVAAAGAVMLGQFNEAAMLAVLFSGSEGLEAYSLARTRRGLRSLLSLAPNEASVVRDGDEVTVAAAELRIGDVLVVRPGERVATDGTVTSGRSSVDLSALTGESMPVETAVGDSVPAAAINGTGALELRVTATAQDNALARIVHIVETEQARKGESQRLADRVARPMVPAIVVLAISIAVVGSLLGDPGVWLSRALVVLVAASPCALAISVPVTVSHNDRRAADHPVLRVTSCTDVCPVFLNGLANGRGLIGEGPGSEPQVRFVGVDTTRDTPEAMKTHLGNLDETFTAVTGGRAEVDAAITALKMAPVEIGEPDSEGNYDVGHPARVFVFSPDNLAHRLYTHDVTPKQWAKDLPTLAQDDWT